MLQKGTPKALHKPTRGLQRATTVAQGGVAGYPIKNPAKSGVSMLSTELRLLNFNISTCFFQFVSNIFSFCFANTFFNSFRSAVY